MYSLLALLFPRISTSTEDIATLSLCYILEHSITARKSFTNFLANTAGISTIPDLYFRTQSSGENKERPDISGLDADGNEIILCEAKFWAGLTSNQPKTYLERLRKNSYDRGKALIFICPNERMVSLWGELLRICEQSLAENKTEISDKTVETNAIMVDGIKMSIVSWRAIINVLRETLAAENSPLISDLDQLNGLCEYMDKQAFIPFKPSDFGLDIPKRVISFYQIVDKVAEKILQLDANVKRLRPTPQYSGYSRYIIVGDYGISIRYSCENWVELAETPFWLTIKKNEGDKWVFAKEARKKLQKYEYTTPKGLFLSDRWNELLIPLYPPIYAGEEEVVDAMFESVRKILSEINE